MSEEKYRCRLCGGDTSRGFVSDFHSSNYFVAKWVEGEPEQTEFLGLKSNVKTAGRRQFEVRSVRCEKCGYLELYGI